MPDQTNEREGADKPGTDERLGRLSEALDQAREKSAPTKSQRTSSVRGYGQAMRLSSEFIAGVNFYLYGRTLSQLTLFQGRLESTQRFLLANSLCEALGEEHRDTTRAQLINQLIQSGRDRDADLPDSPRRRRSAPEAEAVSGLPSAPPPPSPAAASVAAS